MNNNPNFKSERASRKRKAESDPLPKKRKRTENEVSKESINV